MISRKALESIQRVARQLGLPAPTTLAGTDPTAQQFLALANDAGMELMQAVDWPALRHTAAVTIASGTTEYVVRAYVGDSSQIWTADRIIPAASWDSTHAWRFVGAVTDTEWSQWKYGIQTTPIRRIFRTLGKSDADGLSIEVFPTPTASGDALQIPFITDRWALTAGDNNAPADALTTNADSHVFDAHLFDLAISWRFLRAKRLSYDEEFDRFQRLLSKRKADERPGRLLSMAGTRTRHFLDYTNVPDTGYGGT